MDASTTVLGFTGSIGSGCSFISKLIPEVADREKKYIRFKLSDIIRRELKKDGILQPTTKQMQDKGDELRRKNELGGYLVEELIKEIDANAGITAEDTIIIDGIKNEGEVKTLRRFPYFFLFSIHADYDVRKNRVVGGNGKPFATEEDFKEADERDQFEKTDEFGQQVKKCNKLSDIILINDGEIPRADDRQRKEFARKIYDRYCKLIENLRDGKPSRNIFPNIDELCMTIAYSQSKMSSCLKRQVGAVIVDTIKTGNTTANPENIVSQIPTIVSTGYNEVPIGSHKCIYEPNVQQCYRDHLQEQHASNLKRCPECGKELKVESKCSSCGRVFPTFKKWCSNCMKEIDDSYSCPECGCQVFETFLPGSKKNAGKLLDMCRSLHAEEMALLNLLRNTPSTKEKLTLYVTTQPCNLCANKIVSAGVKEVVFDEPYPMKEALDVLRSGRVAYRRFKGIKSTAYFKIYDIY